MDFELEQLRENPQWLLLLQEYRQEATRRREQQDDSAEFDGWVERLSDIDGLRDEQLPRAHGKLIALGLLNFQLTGRTSGVRYQVTSRGLRILNQSDASEEESPLRRSA